MQQKFGNGACTLSDNRGMPLAPREPPRPQPRSNPIKTMTPRFVLSFRSGVRIVWRSQFLNGLLARIKVMKRLAVCLAFLGVTLGRAAAADSVVVFNEIMYHPATNEAALEWVELHNQ